MKTAVRIFIIIILFLPLFILISRGRADKPTDSDNYKLWLGCKLDKILSFEVFNAAVIGYSHTDGIRKKNIFTIIDFSRSSITKRCFVIDMDNKKLLYCCFVAHGRNSGDNIAESFSNDPGSLKSSLGFYLTAETYEGKHGYSLRLDGLEKNINDNARSRDIVMHGAEYVSQQFIEKYGRLGRSWGCPALPADISKEVIDKIALGSCLFIYGKDENYIKTSTFIKPQPALPHPL